MTKVPPKTWVDLIALIVAMMWAILAVSAMPVLAGQVSPEIAFAFSVAAGARVLISLRDILNDLGDAILDGAAAIAAVTWAILSATYVTGLSGLVETTVVLSFASASAMRSYQSAVLFLSKPSSDSSTS